MYMYMYICVCIYIYIYIYVYMCTSICICTTTCIRISITVYVCVGVHAYVYVSQPEAAQGNGRVLRPPAWLFPCFEYFCVISFFNFLVLICVFRFSLYNLIILLLKRPRGSRRLLEKLRCTGSLLESWMLLLLLLIITTQIIINIIMSTIILTCNI